MQLTQMHHRSSPQNNRGFTLVEISIVLVIIGLILGGILNAQSVIRNAQTKDAIKALNDMSAAARQFNDRYGFWPGDYNNVASLPNLVAPCAAVNGNGNGTLTAAESICGTQHLISAGMLKGTIGTALQLRGSTFSVTGRAALPGALTPNIPANWVNVVRVQVTDCDVAVQMDRAADDGNTNTGNFRTALNACGATGNTQSEATAVTDAVLRLN